MLRIDDLPGESDMAHVKVSGRLVDNWVSHFEQICLKRMASNRRLMVHIDELTFADQRGVDVVSRLDAEGVVFVGGSAFMRQRLKLRLS